MQHQTQNHLHVTDTQGRLYVVRVESDRIVTRTPRGAIVQTGGDRFFLHETKEPLVLDPATAKLRTEDGRREFTFKIG
jgi:hypothetical protein